MSKKSFFILIILFTIVGMGYWFYQSTGKATESEKTTLDPKNATYVIEGEEVALSNGRSEKEITPGSASKTVTQYFGNEVEADFNDDGIKDAAFLLTQTGGGSGTFYYVVAALGLENSCRGTNAILLGDRIAPQTTEFRNGEIIVNYAERKPGEPMTTSPSVGVSKYLKISDGQLVVIQKTDPDATTDIIKGAIKRDPPTEWNPQGCGYCFTSDDGKYNCSLMTGKAFSELGGNLVPVNLDEYLDKRVAIYAKKYTGASTMMCPIEFDVYKIEIR